MGELTRHSHGPVEGPGVFSPTGSVLIINVPRAGSPMPSGRLNDTSDKDVNRGHFLHAVILQS